MGACGALISFSSLSKNPAHQVYEFRHTLVRLFSLMHSCHLQEIAVMNEEEFSLIDIRGLDHDTRDVLLRWQKDGRGKAHLTFQWVLNLIVHNMDTGVLPVPAPILTRVFQEISRGKEHADSALKITDTQFPFPYAQTTVVLLLIHSVLSPLVVCAYTGSVSVSAVFTFVAVFVFWCIHFIAVEIEEPFGDDVNDLPLYELQSEMNRSLIDLLDPGSNRVPALSSQAQMNIATLVSDHMCSQSMSQAFGLRKTHRLYTKRSPSCALKKLQVKARSEMILSSANRKSKCVDASTMRVISENDMLGDARVVDVEPGRSMRWAASADVGQLGQVPTPHSSPTLHVDGLPPGAVDDSVHPGASDRGKGRSGTGEPGDKSSPSKLGARARTERPQNTDAPKEALSISRAQNSSSALLT